MNRAILTFRRRMNIGGAVQRSRRASSPSLIVPSRPPRPGVRAAPPRQPLPPRDRPGHWPRISVSSASVSASARFELDGAGRGRGGRRDGGRSRAVPIRSGGGAATAGARERVGAVANQALAKMKSAERLFGPLRLSADQQFPFLQLRFSWQGIYS